MAESNRCEVLIVINSEGYSHQANTWIWLDWAKTGKIDHRTVVGGFDNVKELDLSAYTHAWIADANYLPHPTSFLTLVRKKTPDEAEYVVFGVGEPLAARSFYEDKFTTDKDPHDKYGGLRYVNISGLQDPYDLDKTYMGKDVAFVGYRATRLGFPYCVFMLYSNEPESVWKTNYKTAEIIYPQTVILGSRSPILESHKKLAEHSDTEMFLVLDADFQLESALVTEELKPWEQDSVHLWYARNPINGLVYGHGGPKAFNREAFLNLDSDTVDVTTSAQSKRLIVHEQCTGVHAFNWSAESSWRTAFRECAKLTWAKWVAESKTEYDDANKRLQRWTSDLDKDSKAPYAAECVSGARAGKTWAERVNKQVEAIRVNNFEWLHELFEQKTKME